MPWFDNDQVDSEAVEMQPLQGLGSEVDLAMTVDQIRLRDIESEMNKRLDAKLLQNPDKLPTAVWFILPSELGERFCFYGITPILKNFLKYQLGYTRNVDADMLYHVFTGLAYFTPLIGALISDSYLDKYNTIVTLSTIYILGLGVLTLASWPTFMDAPTTKIPRTGPLLGLLLICIGTGGIKPCVSAHGGDQFLEVQKLGLQKFYNYFYMTINVGALVSSYASPAVAKITLYRFPQETLDEWAKIPLKPDVGNGYPLAWLMLAVSMTVALGVFVVGRKHYRVVPPAGKFILLDHISISCTYLSYLWTRGRETAFELSSLKYGEGMVEEMLDLVQVIFALAPAPIFWMAFGQNGSTWQDMGDQMLIPFGGDAKTSFFNSETTNSIWNPFFIITISPLMANYLYPWIARRFGFVDLVVLSKND
ncbi:UNVERIFIED_CONTAM: hypothetical protein HDU68_005785 [Siphonaria sp. JEL0065]|nr:hypothetical protein HDU68_005785 [Siphonaria sp. JEL0065]